jgi:bifunctional ADP-heptose synthase (sugar kinase/adenylyltransferase)
LRFVDPSYTRKLFEVYFDNPQPFDEVTRAIVADKVVAAVPSADVVIAADFGHGLISPPIVSLLSETSPFLAVNAQTNAGNQGFNLITKYKSADYVCLDAPEARLAVADRDRDIVDIATAVLPQRIDCDRFIITHGRHGCIAYDRSNGPAIRVPAFTNTVVDTVGRCCGLAAGSTISGFSGMLRGLSKSASSGIGAPSKKYRCSSSSPPC